MDVLNELISPALFTDKNLHALVVGRMVNISLEHGNSAASCFAYVWAGAVLRANFGDYPAGFQLRQARPRPRGAERTGPLQGARLRGVFGTLIAPWTRHFRHGLPTAAARLRNGAGSAAT